MNGEVRYWFEQAVNLPAGARGRFLESDCPDHSVRSEVLSLLEYDEFDPESETVPDVVRAALGSVLDGGKPEPRVHRAGRFELGRLLGSGGMGTVYEAQRVDGEVRQRVAVKFVQAPRSADANGRESAHRRFHRERQILASLRHPYIAGLIDAGTTAGGIPYAVIEKVDGVPIDSFCDGSLPGQAGRIRLFLKLCDAVQFAHRNLIVHSDIKPDNVLVTADGVPKLIDFGVASDLADEATLTSSRAFTPCYASPEQSRGLPATVATDVYGLGAVLYRLLTGVGPREFGSGSFGEVIRQICEEDVVRPSAIKPELKGDLENILLKALRREPERRYGSVPELADDLNRYLARRPVRASPDSALYRANRFVRRHWASLGAAAALFSTLAIATFFSVQQRHSALRHAAETRRLAERLLFEVHDEIGGLGGAKAREKLGEIAVQYLEGLERDYGRDPELAWELLNAYSRLAQSRGGGASSVGNTRSGSHFARKALELAAIVERNGPGDARLDPLFAIYQGLGAVFHEAGLRREQRETVDRMLRLAPRLQPLREAQALKELARCLDAEGSERESADAFRRAVSILRTLSRSPSKPPGTDAQLTSALVGLGRAQALEGDFPGAAATLRESIRLAESNASGPNLAKTARQLYWSHIALGDVLGSPQRFSLGRPTDAAHHYQAARGIAESLAHADPGNEMAKLDLARTLSREAVAIEATQPARALALLERSRAIELKTGLDNLSGLDARLTYLTSSVGPLVRLGEFERARDRLAEARRMAFQMRRAGAEVDERQLHRAEAIRLFALGQAGEALAEAKKQLALLPRTSNPVLSANFAAVELLERMRVYAAGVDETACAEATRRLAGIWDDMKAGHPRSRFVLAQAERVHALRQKGCGQ